MSSHQQGARRSSSDAAPPTNSRVRLPEGAEPPFAAYVNGVPQKEGTDFHVAGNHLVFNRSLAKEGSLGFWRWTTMFLGIAGFYKPNDNVDVTYNRGGKQLLATGLEHEPMPSATGDSKHRER